MSTVYPCTTILIGKSLSIDGSIIHAHNEDMGKRTVGRLWKDNSNKSSFESTWVPYVTLEKSNKNLSYWASGNTQQVNRDELNETVLPYDNILVGMNEDGLTMSCNWMYSKDKAMEKKGIRRYAIRQLILERCSGAYEAVMLIASLIDSYGQADWGGLTYVLADPNEAWIVETTAHTWAAKKLKDNEIIAIANRYTIGEDFDLSSANLISMAVKNGWYNRSDGKFNFKNVYGDPEYMNELYDIEREDRIFQLLKSKKGKIKPIDLMEVLRDSYQNTDQYTSPADFEPWRITCREKKAKRPICTNLCQSSFVAHLRPSLPRDIGAVFWFTMATPAYGPYFPIYSIGTKIDASFSKDNSKEANTTAWWAYRHLQEKMDKLSPEMISQYRKKSLEITKSFIKQQADLDSSLQYHFQKGNKSKIETIVNRKTMHFSLSSLNYAKDALKRIKQ
jgi:dipeptidase